MGAAGSSGAASSAGAAASAGWLPPRREPRRLRRSRGGCGGRCSGGGRGLLAQFLQLLHRLLGGGRLGLGLFLAGLADAGKALGHILDTVVKVLLDVRQGRDGLLDGLLDLVEGLDDVLLDVFGCGAGVQAQSSRSILPSLRAYSGSWLGPMNTNATITTRISSVIPIFMGLHDSFPSPGRPEPAAMTAYWTAPPVPQRAVCAPANCGQGKYTIFRCGDQMFYPANR